MPIDRSSPTAGQRLPEYQRDDTWVRSFLAGAFVGQVGTLSDDQPFVTPTLFWYDPQRNELYFHASPAGRLSANLEHRPRACLTASEYGRLLPSNVALEFSLQYRSVMVFGTVQRLEAEADARRALDGLLHKYFPERVAGRDYRPITEQELKRTAVFALQIESWSGKENWLEQADQSDDWPPLKD